MEYITAPLYILAAYILFCKVWPYVLYPNYLRKSRVETYPELRELATRLRGEDKTHTLRNVYAYMQETYTGYGEILKINSLLTVFQFGDFSTNKILHRKQFLWCHTQNRLFKSILVNTGLFREDEIVVQRSIWSSFFIHQWICIDIGGRKIEIDPHYHLLEVGHM